MRQTSLYERSSDYHHSYYWYLTFIEHQHGVTHCKEDRNRPFSSQEVIGKEQWGSPKSASLRSYASRKRMETSDPLFLSFYEEINKTIGLQMRITYNKLSIWLSYTEGKMVLVIPNSMRSPSKTVGLLENIDFPQNFLAEFFKLYFNFMESLQTTLF